MKVVHIISDLSTAGAQTVVMNYLKYWKNSNTIQAKVLPIVRNSEYQYEKYAKNNGIEILDCNYKECASRNPLRSIINWIRLQKAIYRVISAEKPDVIHTHITPILLYVILPVYLLRVKRRIHTLHSDPEALSKFTIFIGRIAFRLFKFYPICVTEDQAKKVEKYYLIRNYSIVRNGLDFNKYSEKIDKTIVRKRFDIPEDAFVVGYVGRLNKIKNLTFFIEVFENLYNLHPKAMCYIAGDGEEREELIKIISAKGLEKRIVFLGVREDIELFYKAIDIFMITSFYESSSIVTVEAQLSGVKCVISDRIPRNVVISNNVVRLSLDDSIDNWVAAILGKLRTEYQITDRNKYSLIDSVQQIESIYQAEETKKW